MDIENYKYLWITEKENWVLVNTEFGYAVVNNKNKTILSFSNEKLEEEIIKIMRKEGNKTYDNIIDSYNDKLLS